MMVGKSKLKVPVGQASSECCYLCFNNGVIVISSHPRAEATPSQDKGQRIESPLLTPFQWTIVQFWWTSSFMKIPPQIPLHWK